MKTEEVGKAELLKVYEICKRDTNKIPMCENLGVDIVKECIVYKQPGLALWFIDNNATVDMIDDRGRTTLSYACELSSPAIINKIEERSSLKTKKISHAMHYAIVSGNKEHIEALVNNGYSFEEKGPNGESLIVTALRAIEEDEAKEKRIERLRIIELLLKNAIDTNDIPSDEVSRLSSIDKIAFDGILKYCYESDLTNTLVFLVKKGLNAHLYNLQLESDFEFFIEKNEKEIVKFILEHSKAVDIQHTSALLKACNNYSMLRLLLDNGVKVKGKGLFSSMSILNYVAYHIDSYYNREFVEILIEYGADINKKTDYHWSPLVQLLLIRDDNHKEKQKEFFDLLMKHRPVIDDIDLTKGFTDSRPNHIEDILDVAVSQGRYDWFKPYFHQMTETEQEFFESKRINNLLQLGKKPVKLEMANLH